MKCLNKTSQFNSKTAAKWRKCNLSHSIIHANETTAYFKGKLGQIVSPRLLSKQCGNMEIHALRSMKTRKVDETSDRKIEIMKK